MEDLNNILDRIQQHNIQENKFDVPNMAIGRSFISYLNYLNNRDQEIWITNRERRRTSTDIIDITGTFRGTSDTGKVDTFQESGSIVTSKNTIWGRKLLEHFQGEDFCIARDKTKIKFEIHNSASYNPFNSGVSDLKIGLPEFRGFRRFKSIEQARLQLVQSSEELNKKIEEEKAAKAKAELLKAEAERKKKEAELELKRIKDEEQARILAEQRKREEEERQAQIHAEEERLAQLEKDRQQMEAHYTQLADQYKNSVSFIRKQASLRLNPVLDHLQNDIKFSHIYDGVAVVIDGGPGTGKTTTLIQRLKYLISREDLEDYNLYHPESKLTEEQLEIVSNDKANWIFFSPSEVLRQYLKENMNYEGLSDTKHKTVVYRSFLNDRLRDDYDIFGDGKPFEPRSKRFQGTILIKDNQLKVVERFTHFYIQSIKKLLMDVAELDVSPFKWKQIGQIVISKCKEADSVSNFKDLCRILFALDELKNQIISNIKINISDIVKEYTEKVNNICYTYLSQWKKDDNLYKGLLDAIKDKKGQQDTDDEDDVDEEDMSADALEVQLMKQLRILVRKLSLKQMDVSVKLGKKSTALYSLVNEKIDVEELKSIGECAFFVQKIYNPILRNYEQLIFSRIPRIYKEFRREVLKSGNVQWNQVLLKDIVVSQKNRLLHPDEQSLLFGFINNLVVGINKVSGLKFQNLRHKYALAYKALCRPVIGIDEATDYCMLDYYAIASLRHYKISTFALTGDIMQGLRKDGIEDWNSLINPLIFSALEVMSLKVSYRQSPEMLALAKNIYLHSMNKEPEYTCYMSDEEKTPKPLWIKSDDDEEKAEWISERIIEVKRAYGFLPSIAVFVSDESEARVLKDELEDLGRLESQGIGVVDCSGGDKLSEENVVRIFPLELVKGMEFEVVFFHNIDKVVNSLVDRYLYVGLSRATFFVGVTSSTESNESCRELEPMFDFSNDWSEIVR